LKEAERDKEKQFSSYKEDKEKELMNWADNKKNQKK